LQHFQNIYQRLDSISQEINPLSQRIDSFSQRIDSSSQKIDFLSQEVGSLSEKVGPLSGKVDSLSGKVDFLSERMDSLEKQVTSIENDHGEKLAALLDGHKLHTEILERHTTQLERIESKIESHDIQISVSLVSSEPSRTFFSDLGTLGVRRPTVGSVERMPHETACRKAVFRMPQVFFMVFGFNLDNPESLS